MIDHRPKFNGVPFLVYPIHRDEPIAAFSYRIDAFDFARKETLPNLKRGDTGYPFLCVERVVGNDHDMHIFRAGKLIDKHGTVIE
jgi:hypothetical protein